MPATLATGRGEEERLVEALTEFEGTTRRPPREVGDMEVDKGIREEGGAVLGKSMAV